MQEKLNAKGYLGKADWMAEDTLNYDHCVEIAETVKKTYGRIDILVCAQGILIHKPIDVLTLDEWQKVVDVNMTSVFYSIKAVVPIMKEQNYGRIVLVSSIGGRKGRPGVGVNYYNTKL
ncbi:MAG: SDR family oxidoreductase [Lachnospiraceae bacterium]